MFDIDSEGHISDQMLRSIVTNYNINTYGGSAVNNNIVKSTTTPHVPPSQQTPLMQRRQSVVAAPSSAKHQSAGKQRTTKPQGLRYDKDVMLKFFDRDGDGGIGLNDFISLTNNAAKQSQQ